VQSAEVRLEGAGGTVALQWCGVGVLFCRLCAAVTWLHRTALRHSRLQET
jgi:hypothetical protein